MPLNSVVMSPCLVISPIPNKNVFRIDLNLSVILSVVQILRPGKASEILMGPFNLAISSKWSIVSFGMWVIALKFSFGPKVVSLFTLHSANCEEEWSTVVVPS